MQDFTEIREPHEVTEGMNDDTGSEVTCLNKEVGGVDAKDGCVGKLEGGDEKGVAEALSCP